MDITLLGRPPIDLHLSACLDGGESFMEKYPDSHAAEASRSPGGSSTGGRNFSGPGDYFLQNIGPSAVGQERQKQIN
jgi:hypothetical protein